MGGHKSWLHGVGAGTNCRGRPAARQSRAGLVCCLWPRAPSAPSLSPLRCYCPINHGTSGWTRLGPVSRTCTVPQSKLHWRSLQDNCPREDPRQRVVGKVVCLLRCNVRWVSDGGSDLGINVDLPFRREINGSCTSEKSYETLCWVWYVKGFSVSPF